MDHYIHDNQIQSSKKKKDQPQMLIVDDEIFNITAMRIVLKYVFKIKNLDTTCTHAMNGQQAIDLIKQNVEQNKGKYCSYSIIFMDCNMPVLDGYEAT